jgi:hypothetical protein
MNDEIDWLARPKMTQEEWEKSGYLLSPKLEEAVREFDRKVRNFRTKKFEEK